MLKMTRQMSESYLLGGLLTLIGGFLDAYTYLSRGKVFANAQTGNVVLLGLHIADGDFKGALFYLMPVLTFAVGVLISSFIKDKFKGKSKLHWRQIVVAIEAAALLAVTFLKSNMAANILVSFVCALQAQTFRKVHGHALATTMCTGNLRIATETLYSAAKTKSRKLVSKAAFSLSAVWFLHFCLCLSIPKRIKSKRKSKMKLKRLLKKKLKRKLKKN